MVTNCENNWWKEHFGELFNTMCALLLGGSMANFNPAEVAIMVRGLRSGKAAGVELWLM